MYQFVSVAVAVLAALAAYYYTQNPDIIHRLLSLTPFQAVTTGECKAGKYLTEVHDVVGFHVACVTYDQSSKEILVKAYLNGRNNTVEYKTRDTVTDFRKASDQYLNIKYPEDPKLAKLKQPWRVFSTEGKALTSINDIVKEQTVFIFEGGQFIWPGVKVGHRFQIHNIEGWDNIWAETVSMIPLVLKIEEFLTDGECELIKELSLPHLKASGVSLMDKDKVDPKLREIDVRVEQLTKVPKSHQEDAQVLRYEHTQKYDAHHDYFNPDHYSSSPDVLASIDYGYKNRMITVFWYMSDVAQGGHTAFPRSGGLPPPASNKDCTIGLRVAPKKRMVIIFYSLLPNGEGDEYSLHGGCPVIEGTKFAVNKWVWNKPFK